MVYEAVISHKHPADTRRIMDGKKCCESMNTLSRGTIKVILRGMQFDIDLSALQRLPDSRLGKLAQNYDTLNNSHTVYFNRNPYLFHNILDFYESGNLHFGSDTCVGTIQDELEFWCIPEYCLSPCCHRRYTEQLQQDQDRENMLVKLQSFTQDQAVCIQIATNDGYDNSLRARAWRFLSDTSYSRAARVSLFKITTDMEATTVLSRTFCLAHTHQQLAVGDMTMSG